MMTTDQKVRAQPLVTQLVDRCHQEQSNVDDDLTLADEILPRIIERCADAVTSWMDTRFTRVRQETTDDD